MVDRSGSSLSDGTGALDLRYSTPIDLARKGSALKTDTMPCPTDPFAEAPTSNERA
jgi:hypothetical protein